MPDYTLDSAITALVEQEVNRRMERYYGWIVDRAKYHESQGRGHGRISKWLIDCSPREFKRET